MHILSKPHFSMTALRHAETGLVRGQVTWRVLLEFVPVANLLGCLKVSLDGLKSFGSVLSSRFSQTHLYKSLTKEIILNKRKWFGRASSLAW